MVVDRRGDDHLVRGCFGHEPAELCTDGLRRADERPAQHCRGTLLLGRRPVVLDVVDRGRQLPAAAAQDVGEGLLGRGEQPARRLVVVRDDHVRAHHRVRLLQLFGRLELVAVDLERRQQRVGGEVGRERVGQPEHGGELGAEQARAQDPERDVRAGAGSCPHGLTRLRIRKVVPQLDDVPRERVGAHRISPQREHRELVRAGRTAQTEVDPARMQRLERPELLGDHERRMVRQHDPAGPDANRLRPVRDVRDHDRGRRAGDPDRVVVLGEPEPLVPPPLGVLREVEGVTQCVGDGRAVDDRRQVENGERGNRHDPEGCRSRATRRGGWPVCGISPIPSEAAVLAAACDAARRAPCDSSCSEHSNLLRLGLRGRARRPTLPASPGRAALRPPLRRRARLRSGRAG